MKNKIFIFAIVVLQIFLIVNLTTATSWEIRESQKENYQNSILIGGEKIKSLVKKTLSLVGGFISIKQIGIVSAIAGESFCCEKMTEVLGGATCQNVDNMLKCDGQFRKAPTICDETDFCKKGVCYDSSSGVCMIGSPKEECIGNDGSWTQTQEEEPRCSKGCCMLGRNTQFTTRANCRILSEQQGSQIDFQGELTQEQCTYYSPEEGACVFDDGNCKRTNQQDCESSGGDFSKGFLCSYFNEPGQKWAGAGCKKTDHIGCSDKENEYDIFWYDSCGNKENIYNGKNYATTSWGEGKIKDKGALACSNQNDCGICKYEEGIGKCTASGMGNGVQAGDYYCKPLTCTSVDKFGDGTANDIAKNGESWCVYDRADSSNLDGWVGSDLSETNNQRMNLIGVNPSGFFGRDAVGQGHFMRYCDEGDIVTVPCGTGERGEICAEIQYEDGTMRAQCRANLGFSCFSFQTPEDCVASPNVDCRWQGVGVDSYFEFGACVPKYPKGFDLNPTDDETTGTQNTQTQTESGQTKEEELCNLGSQECKYVEQKECGAMIGSKCEWKCISNCECKGKKFAVQMNEFCISLGDCGGYVNVAGDYDGRGWSASGSESFVGADLTFRTDDQINSQLEKENQEAWKNDNTEEAFNLQNTPTFIPLEGSEGTYGDLGIYGAQINPDVKKRFDAWSLSFKVFGGAGALSGLVGFGFLIALARSMHGAYFSAIKTLTEGTNTLSTWGKVGMGGGLTGIGAFTSLGQLIGTLIGDSVGQGETYGTVGSGVGFAGAVGAIILDGKNFALFFAGPVGIGIASVLTAYSIAQTVWTFTNGNGDTREKSVKFKCMPWRAPLTINSAQCEKCNDNLLGTPCTKYKCESLGSGCRLLTGFGNVVSEETVNNPVAEIQNPVCVDLGKCGVTGGSPVAIELKYVSIGFKVGTYGSGKQVLTNEGGNIPENSIFNLTFETDDYGVCKYNYFRKDYASFETEGEMFNEGNYPTLNHTLSITVPWMEDERVQNKELKLFVRCMDKCGKYINPTEYEVSLPIFDSPDTTAPLITEIRPASPIFMPFGANASIIKVVTNEPARCSYDFNQGILFGNMVGGNGIFGNPSENGEEFYSAVPVSNLNQPENQIYLKCQDQRGNNNTEDFPVIFKKSPAPLNITNFVPMMNSVRKTEVNENNPIILGLTTIGGAFEGASNCSWTLRKEIISIGGDSFRDNGQPTHEYKLTSQLASGDYKVEYSCFDSAGNTATEKTNFTIENDQTSPVVIRVYIEGGTIKMITNEESRCFYNSTADSECEFSTGTEMDSSPGFIHTISYEADKTYYVKCKDEFNNQNEKCAIIARPGVF